nr:MULTISPECIES: helix-turn-helix transcriptional regulator [unclassified Desulfovibrio]
MSRKELAARIDGSESHIKAIESRKRNPTITVLSCLPRHWASTQARCYLRSNKDSPI